jgi:hypothetical protein
VALLNLFVYVIGGLVVEIGVLKISVVAIRSSWQPRTISESLFPPL